ncbi:hypothetical protein A0E43_13780 [Pectobacterium cacticida]
MTLFSDSIAFVVQIPYGRHPGSYTFAAIDSALAANAIASGSTTLSSSEGINHGEALFESLGKLCDPKEGAERGRQVFTYNNLAMLTPAALGAAKIPGFNKTQGTGASKITDIMGKIKRGRNGWTTEKMGEVALIAIDSYFLDYKEGTFSIVEWLEEKLGDVVVY